MIDIPLTEDIIKEYLGVNFLPIEFYRILPQIISDYEIYKKSHEEQQKEGKHALHI